MSRVERPSVSASRSAVRASAAAGSRCSAGSSSTRMGKSASRARATATRWRCPPERRAPPGPTAVARPVGQSGQPSAQADPAEHARELVVGGGAPADPEVLGQRRVEEVGALLDQPDDPPHVVGGEALQRHPVERGLAGVGRQEAHQHVGQRRLAGAARADQRHPAPGRQVAGRRRAARRGRRPGRRPRRRAGRACAGRRPARPDVAGSLHDRLARPWPRRPGPPPRVSAGAPGWPPAAATTSSNAASGTRARTASSAPLSEPAWVASTPSVRAPQLASPASAVVRPRPMPVVPAPWRAIVAQPAVRVVDAAQLLADARP